MPLNAITMPYLSQVSMTCPSRMEPPGSTMAVTPERRARSMLSPKGKNASLPRQTPVTLDSHSFFSAGVNGSGRVVKVSAHTPSPSTSSHSSEIYTSMALSRLGRETSGRNGRPSTLGRLSSR